MVGYSVWSANGWLISFLIKKKKEYNTETDWFTLISRLCFFFSEKIQFATGSPLPSRLSSARRAIKSAAWQNPASTQEVPREVLCFQTIWPHGVSCPLFWKGSTWVGKLWKFCQRRLEKEIWNCHLKRLIDSFPYLLLLLSFPLLALLSPHFFWCFCFLL